MLPMVTLDVATDTLCDANQQQSKVRHPHPEFLFDAFQTQTFTAIHRCEQFINQLQTQTHDDSSKQRDHLLFL